MPRTGFILVTIVKVTSDLQIEDICFSLFLSLSILFAGVRISFITDRRDASFTNENLPQE